MVCFAESLPFADGSFDLVVTRIAAHHFVDVSQAVAELVRVSRSRVLVVDIRQDDAGEEAERLRDPSHVRNYTEPEWRGFLEAAGAEVEAVRVLDVRIELEARLERTGCAGGDAARVRELLAGRTWGGQLAMRRIALRAAVQR